MVCTYTYIDFSINLQEMATRLITISCKPMLKIFNKRSVITFASSVHKVAEDAKALSQLVDKLKAGLPATNMVYVCARNAQDNKILSNFYTDGWPDFSTVICQIQKPRLSDESDLLCYSTCEASILSLLQESGVITWGRRQLIEGLESDHADHLIETLHSLNSTVKGEVEGRYEGSLFYYPYKHIQPPPSIPGFTLDKLKPCHLKYVVDDFTFYPDIGRHIVEKYLDHLIRHFHSAAVFKNDNLDRPIGWIYTTAYGGGGFHYVDEEFRGRGISNVLRIALGRQMIANGDIAMGIFDREHVGLGRLTGGVEMHSVKMVILKQ